MNKKIIAAIGALVLIVVAGWAIYSSNAKPQKAPEMQPAAVTSTPGRENPLASWNEHSYPALGYSFQLPADYSLTTSQPSPNETFVLQSLNVIPGDSGESWPNGAILTVQSANSLEEGIQRTQASIPDAKFQETTINGLRWLIFDWGRNELLYMTYKNGRLYTIDGRSGNELVGKILSSYRFAGTP